MQAEVCRHRNWYGCALRSLVGGVLLTALGSVFVIAQTPPGNDPGSQKLFNMEMGPNRSIFRPSLDPERKANGLAQTPPMGWNSWNKFGCKIDEKAVRAVTDAIVSSGMRDGRRRLLAGQARCCGQYHG